MAPEIPELPVLAEHRAEAPRRRPLCLALAQLAGPWLDLRARFDRLVAAARLARDVGADVVAFPETYLAGYPFWLPRTGGAAFEDPDQKACYAYYLQSALEIGGPYHRDLETLAGDLGLTLVVGVSERVGGTVFCTLLTVRPGAGTVVHHRKLVPTYDERLVWAHGDGAGLRVTRVEGIGVGALNCWENWMPQARSALHAQGEEVHVGVWPGSSRLTSDVTRFAAVEGRMFAAAASGLYRVEDVPDDFPLAAALRDAGDPGFDGGSAVARPDGRWLVEPQAGREGLVVAELDPDEVAAARLTFDPAGHYARPDVFHTTVDRRRRTTTGFVDG
jgi:nitrilase